jgi:choline dehydrogenase
LLIQRIARTKAMQSLIRESIAPDLDAMTPADLIADFRARAATVYHPVSTCRMGRPRPTRSSMRSCACTASKRCASSTRRFFRRVTSANTNAPTLMVAQKAADLILNVS